MAKSNSHKLGQMIGDFFEILIITKLKNITDEYNLYLDYKHPRKSRNDKSEVIWIDNNNNKHKLDIVIEENGSDFCIGNPKAFIEMAWRRYTKHSKNKAQEISGAIKPLIAKYSKFSPFYGVVLSGEFTKSSLAQLESEGFKVLYFDINEIINAFSKIGLNIMWEQDTSEETLGEYIKDFQSISEKEKDILFSYIWNENAKKINEFIKSLKSCFNRKIIKIRLFTLYGDIIELDSIEKTIAYINAHTIENTIIDTLIGYELYVYYNNGDRIETKFKEKRDIINFLNELH